MAWNAGDKKTEVKRGVSGKTVPLRPGGKELADEMSEDKLRAGTGKAGGRDLVGGMEILEMDFLLRVIENTKSDDKNDVTMQKLGFNELIRREELNEIDSSALKIYVKDANNLYGKIIQCAAMKELAIRTSHKGKM